MTILEKIKDLQGERTQLAFAADLGIGQSLLSQVQTGQRRVSLHLAQILTLKYPEHADEIASLFLAQSITRTTSRNHRGAY